MKANEEIVQRVLSAVINAEPRVSWDIEALTDKLRDALSTPNKEAKADEVVTGLYRLFKGWSKRGFGPDDVTWCEVKAAVMSLIE